MAATYQHTTYRPVNPKKSRCRYIVLAVIVIAIIVAIALAVGLYYGLKDRDDESPVPLKVLSVRSAGRVGNTTKITVTYQATADHSMEWRFVPRHRAMIRTGGTCKQTEKDGVAMHECSDEAPVSAKISVHLVIRSGSEFVYMRLNSTTLSSAWMYEIPSPQNIFLNFNSTVLTPDTGDLNISLSLRLANPNEEPLGPEQASRGIYAYLTYLNTSAKPPGVGESYIDVDDLVVPERPHHAVTVEATARISLKNDYVKYGGVFSVQLPEYVNPKFVEISYGKWMYVLRAETKQVIPEGEVGCSYLEPTVAFFDGSVTVSCFCLGNPAPDVQIFKEVSGKSHLVKSETLLKDEVTHSEVVTLTNRKTDIGNYTCRVTSGSKTVTHTIEVFAAEETEFIDNMTRLVENTAEKTVVQCAVTGIPTPKLLFREDCYHGPDLADSGRDNVKYNYQTAGGKPSLTMTISPPDANITSVCCLAAAQTRSGVDSYRSISLSPEVVTKTP